MTPWDTLAQACEAALLTPEALPVQAWLAARGAPLSGRGLGYGVPLTDPSLDPQFVRWAAHARWAGSFIVVTRDWVGRVVGFQVRPLDEKIYLRYDLYDTKIVPPLWGADTAIAAIWAHKRILLVEGSFDALACRAAGADHVIATMGARISRAAKRWLPRLAKRVTILYDMDATGRDAATRLHRDLPKTMVVSIPEYGAHDPDELWQQRPHVLRSLVDLSKL